MPSYWTCGGHLGNSTLDKNLLWILIEVIHILTKTEWTIMKTGRGSMHNTKRYKAHILTCPRS